MSDADVLVLAGTADARELVRLLAARGLAVLVSTATPHAGEQYTQLAVSVRHGRLDRDGLLALVREWHIRVTVDATHPFAEEAHREARAAAESASVPYLRYERLPVDDALPDCPASPLVHWVADDAEAAELAASLGGVVFLTTGSKQLALYARRLSSSRTSRVVVRLLPTVENLERCAALGIDQADIVAMQGPFGETLNRGLYDRFGVHVLVTKESGVEGGLPEKIRPALDIGAHVIIIRRPAQLHSLRFHHRDELAAYVTDLLRPASAPETAK